MASYIPDVTSILQFPAQQYKCNITDVAHNSQQSLSYYNIDVLINNH